MVVPTGLFTLYVHCLVRNTVRPTTHTHSILLPHADDLLFVVLYRFLFNSRLYKIIFGR
jgi:hypothetical protein